MNNQINEVEANHEEALREEALRITKAREEAEIAYKEAILFFWETSRRDPSLEESVDPADSRLQGAMSSLMKTEGGFLEAYLSEELSRLDASQGQQGA